MRHAIQQVIYNFCLVPTGGDAKSFDRSDSFESVCNHVVQATLGFVDWSSSRLRGLCRPKGLPHSDQLCSHGEDGVCVYVCLYTMFAKRASRRGDEVEHE